MFCLFCKCNIEETNSCNFVFSLPGQDFNVGFHIKTVRRLVKHFRF